MVNVVFSPSVSLKTSGHNSFLLCLYIIFLTFLFQFFFCSFDFAFVIVAKFHISNEFSSLYQHSGYFLLESLERRVSGYTERYWRQMTVQKMPTWEDQPLWCTMYFLIFFFCCIWCSFYNRIYSYHFWTVGHWKVERKFEKYSDTNWWWSQYNITIN